MKGWEIMKKFILSTIMMVLFVPSAVSAAAIGTYGAGEWDAVGYVETIQLTTTGVDVTQTVSSGGGNFKIKITNAIPDNVYRIWLYEKDSTGSTMIPHSPKYGYGNYEHTWDVSSYVDGSDGKAEIYAHIGYADIAESITIQFLD
jgi:hypothetical protein